MNNAIILPGKPKKERYLDPTQPKPHEANWLPWLADQLEQRGVPTVVVAMPRPYEPIYEDWCRTFEALAVGVGTIIIGHSAGAGFIIRWLSEHSEISIAQLILIAPWHDSHHEYGKEFFDYVIDAGLAQRVSRITIVNSIDDGQSIQDSVVLLRQEIPGINYVELQGYGHFMLGNAMSTTMFPRILEEIETQIPTWQ
jgi:predicted alpha/beta hydrolase family esterase